MGLPWLFRRGARSGAEQSTAKGCLVSLSLGDCRSAADCCATPLSASADRLSVSAKALCFNAALIVVTLCVDCLGAHYGAIAHSRVD